MDGASRDEQRRAIEALHAASFAWARACAADPDEAEDVLQTAYEKILSGRARFDARSSLKTWIFGVIRLTALEHRRRALLRALRLVPLAREPSAKQPPSSDEARVIVRALSALPERQRQVIHLVFYEELTVEEAALAMGVGVGTARVHYDRGKKRMRELLGGASR